MKKNLFIAFEGIDGSGKSTQVRLLATKLEQAGHKVFTTCEPTESRIGSIIRDVFSHRMAADHRVIAGLFVADRLNHLLEKENGILKKLEDGYTVITDRYYFSSYAYQGAHMPLQWVIEANKLSAQLLRPDINIFIDIPVEISMNRIKTNRATQELYETRENLKKVRDKYIEAFRLLEAEEHIYVVDGDRQPETIAGEIWNQVRSKISAG